MLVNLLGKPNSRKLVLLCSGKVLKFIKKYHIKDHIDEITLRFLSHCILILPAIYKINAYKKFKNQKKTNVPKMSFFSTRKS